MESFPAKLLGFASSKLLITVAILLVLAIGGAYVAWKNGPHPSDTERQAETMRLVRLAAKDAQDLFGGTRPLLSSLIQIPAVREKDGARCSEILAETITQHPFYERLAASDKNGDIFCLSSPIEEPINITDRAYFQRAKETRDFVVGDYSIGRSSKVPVLVFAYPLLDVNGEFDGLVLASVSLRWLENFAAQAQLPDGAVITIFDMNGFILARYPSIEEWSGKEVPEYPLVKFAAAQQEGSTIATGLDNKERLYAFTAMPGVRFDGGAVYLSIGLPR